MPLSSNDHISYLAFSKTAASFFVGWYSRVIVTIFCHLSSHNVVILCKTFLTMNNVECTLWMRWTQGFCGFDRSVPPTTATLGRRYTWIILQIFLPHTKRLKEFKNDCSDDMYHRSLFGKQLRQQISSGRCDRNHFHYIPLQFNRFVTYFNMFWQLYCIIDGILWHVAHNDITRSSTWMPTAQTSPWV